MQQPEFKFLDKEAIKEIQECFAIIQELKGQDNSGVDIPNQELNQGDFK